MRLKLKLRTALPLSLLGAVGLGPRAPLPCPAQAVAVPSGAAGDFPGVDSRLIIMNAALGGKQSSLKLFNPGD